MGLSQADAARRLNCLVVLFSDFGINTNPKILVCRRTCFGRPRATTPAEDHFLALSARRRRTTTVPQLVADPFKHQEEESPLLRCEMSEQCRSVCKKPVVCVPLNGRQRRNRLCWTRKHVSWTQQPISFCAVHDDSPRFTMHKVVESWFGQGSRSVATLTCICSIGGTVTGLRYQDETLDPYVRPYAAAIGNDFILMDDNARPHRARIVESIWRITVWNEWNCHLDLRPESDRTSLGLSWQIGCCFKSSSRVVT
ncbi:transposable element Tcb2 transposase [Trichonephila clavipes]|nr:transposable element Tcb2 transposase [Trichonephila clavipes]